MTGCNGLLGATLVHRAAGLYEVVATSRATPTSVQGGVVRIRMDITDASEVWAVVQRISPDVIVHCAAETRVDYCEEYPDRAEAVNVTGTSNVAQAGESVGAVVVYISSDSVFDGRSGGYSETDKPSPVNVYSKSKLQGEQEVQQRCSDHLILRSNMFGWNMLPKESIAEWMLANLRNGRPFSAFQDVFFSPLVVNDLARLLFEMYEGDIRGLYHLGAHDHISKHQFALKIADLFQLDGGLVLPSKVACASLKARRPRATFLNVSAGVGALGHEMPSVGEELRLFLALENSGYVAELKSGSGGEGLNSADYPLRQG